MKTERIRDEYASYIAQHDEFVTACYCENCGHILGYKDFSHPSCSGHKFDKNTNFCPKCGKSL